MRDMIKSLFKKEQSSAKGADQFHKLQVATCALLLEIAHADDEFSQEEKRSITDNLKNQFHLSKEEADELMEVAEKERKQSIDLWRFAGLINKNCSVEEKIQMIEMIWDLIYVDECLHAHEDYLVHKLATLLGLSHKQLIDAKMKVKSSR